MEPAKILIHTLSTQYQNLAPDPVPPPPKLGDSMARDPAWDPQP